MSFYVPNLLHIEREGRWGWGGRERQRGEKDAGMEEEFLQPFFAQNHQCKCVCMRQQESMSPILTEAKCAQEP